MPDPVQPKKRWAADKFRQDGVEVAPSRGRASKSLERRFSQAPSRRPTASSCRFMTEASPFDIPEGTRHTEVDPSRPENCGRGTRIELEPLKMPVGKPSSWPDRSRRWRCRARSVHPRMTASRSIAWLKRPPTFASRNDRQIGVENQKELIVPDKRKHRDVSGACSTSPAHRRRPRTACRFDRAASRPRRSECSGNVRRRSCRSPVCPDSSCRLPRSSGLSGSTDLNGPVPTPSVFRIGDSSASISSGDGRRSVISNLVVGCRGDSVDVVKRGPIHAGSVLFRIVTTVAASTGEPS